MKLPALLVLGLLAGPVVALADAALDEKFEGLKDAVANKNPESVKKLALELFPMVAQAECEPAPEDQAEKPAWSSRVKHAKDIGAYTEYALFATAVGSPPAVLIVLVATREQQNPKSKYLDSAYGPYLLALSQAESASKVIPIAVKALANFPENEDLLLVLADNAVTQKQPDRALSLSNRLVAALLKHPKPEGMSAAQWDRKSNATLGRGYWISGVIYGERGQYANADKNLRAALPLIQGNDPMMAAALFYLGMANYQLGKMTLSKAKVLEAAKFSQQSAAIAGPYAEQARHNALVMKQEADRMR